MSATITVPIKGEPCPVPYDQRAEESVLGFFLHEPSIFPRVRRHLDDDSFFSPGARNVFQVMCDIADRGEAISLEDVAHGIDALDFFALTDAVAHCAMTRILFYCDLGVVLRDAARRKAEVAA